MQYKSLRECKTVVSACLSQNELSDVDSSYRYGRYHHLPSVFLLNHNIHRTIERGNVLGFISRENDAGGNVLYRVHQGWCMFRGNCPGSDMSYSVNKPVQNGVRTFPHAVGHPRFALGLGQFTFQLVPVKDFMVRTAYHHFALRLCSLRISVRYLT